MPALRSTETLLGEASEEECISTTYSVKHQARGQTSLQATPAILPLPAPVRRARAPFTSLEPALFAGDHVAGLLRYAAGDLRTQRSSRAVASSRVSDASDPVRTIVLPSSGAAVAAAWGATASKLRPCCIASASSSRAVAFALHPGRPATCASAGRPAAMNCAGFAAANRSSIGESAGKLTGAHGSELRDFQVHQQRCKIQLLSQLRTRRMRIRHVHRRASAVRSITFWFPRWSKKCPSDRATSPPISGTDLNSGHGR